MPSLLSFNAAASPAGPAPIIITLYLLFITARLRSLFNLFYDFLQKIASNRILNGKNDKNFCGGLFYEPYKRKKQNA